MINVIRCSLLAAGLAALPAGAAVSVFEAGERRVAIVVPDAAPAAEREAAAELARVLGEMSGLAWPVVAEADAPAGPALHVGRTRTAALHGAALRPALDILAVGPGETGPDGFRIRSAAGSVFLEGATPEATYFAVTWLLREQAGVQWFVPGPEGEVIPRRRAWTLPDLEVTQEPAYVSREIYGLASAAEREWARRQGLRARLEFGHALSALFPPAVLEANPEWAPVVDGQRHRPATTDDYHWQPNLALPAVADFAGRLARAALEREPERVSFSLGINDSVRFDQSAATRAAVEPLRYFRGRPDYSPLVFQFMNRAAEALAGAGPGRYLGCLAYFWCENAPDFPVHPRVVPFLTADRTQYYDAGYRSADLELMERWRATGIRAFGLWEYGEGVNFIVPRVPVRAVADGLREGWRRGARGYFAEVVPQWGFDAPKVWILSRLLWQPAQCAEALADEFFAGYFGPAASAMRRFFAACEEIWMRQAGPPYWLKYYQQEDQALLFPTDVCRDLRRLLDAAEAEAAEPVERARVARTSRAFAVTEALAVFDAARRRLAGWPAETLDSPAGFAAATRAIRDLVAARAELEARFAAAEGGEAPALHGTRLELLLRNDPVPRLLRLAARRDPGAADRLLATAGPEARLVTEWRILAGFPAGGPAAGSGHVARNSDFAAVEGGAGGDRFLFPRDGVRPADWVIRAAATETGQTARVAVAAGGFALRLEGAWDTQVFQWHPIGPGGAWLATARLRGVVSVGSDAGLFLTFLASDGQVAGRPRMQSLPKARTTDWWDATLADRAPDDAAWVGVGIAASRQVAGDWLEATQVELRGAEMQERR